MNFFNSSFDTFLNVLLIGHAKLLHQLVLRQRQFISQARRQLLNLNPKLVNLFLHLLQVERDLLALLADHQRQPVLNFIDWSGCNL
jgi:hypothetical protein